MPYSDHGNDADEGTDDMNTTLTNAQLFDQLNLFRAANGKAPLKVLKLGRNALIDALNKEAPKTIVHAGTADTTATLDIKDPIGDDTTNRGTANPEKSAALKAARTENAAKDAALAKLEAESPSPSATTEKEVVAKIKKADKIIEKAVKGMKPSKGKPAAGFSAAKVLEEFGITGKIGRALLRKHNVTRTPEAIRAFLKARAK